MNRLRVAALLREIAAELEAADEPKKRARRAPLELVPPAPVDELAQAEAKRILRRKGLSRK